MSDLPIHGRLASTALAIFDQTAAAHRLPSWARRALTLAAETISAARSLPAENAERMARDSILADSTSQLEPNQRAVAACAAIFQRAKLRSHREAAFTSLSPRNQVRAMRLAAILQIANSIAKTKATTLAVSHAEETTTLTIDADAIQLSGQADFWRETIGTIKICTVAIPSAEEQSNKQAHVLEEGLAPLAWRALDEELLLSLQITLVNEELDGAELAGEGARRVLRRFFERMLAREDAVLKAEDAEDVHQMRVATRRLRASLQVVEGIFEPKRIRHYRRGLRRIAQSLGGVRDSDVFLIALNDYRATLSSDSAMQIDPLIEAVTTERARARVVLLADLQSARYTRFKHELAIFLTTYAAEIAPLPMTGIPPRIRDLAGSVIWRRYEDLRAFEPILSGATDETLHLTRIAGKRLRYTLEFFADALGPRADELLELLALLQEHLGAIQDAAAAHAHIAQLAMLAEPGARSYIDHLATRRASLIEDLPRIWEKVTGKTYRRKLFEAILKV